MSNKTSTAADPLTKGEIEAWCVVYGVEGFLTVFGNAIAILVFLITPSLHKRTYYLLVSLAVADFLVGALAVPMFIYVLGTYFGLWPKETDIDEAQTIVEVCVSYASIYSLTAIAIERMLAIVLPWKHSMESKTSYIAAIIVTWLLSILTGSFIIFYREGGETRTGFFVTIMVLLGLCLLITLVCYVVISMKLCSHDDTLSSLPNRAQRERQLAITLLLVSIVFLITWLPFKVLNHIFFFNYDHAQTLSYHYVLASKLLHYFNSLVNPFIYAFRIPDFKRGLKNLFCCSGSDAPDPNKNANGAWTVNGINGPQTAKNPDNVVSMTTVSQALDY